MLRPQQRPATLSPPSQAKTVGGCQSMMRRKYFLGAFMVILRGTVGVQQLSQSYGHQLVPNRQRTVSLVFSQLRSLSLVFFLLFLSLLCSLVLLHPRVHYLEMTSDSSWPPDLTAYTFFGYNIGDLPFLLAKSSLLVETIKERKKPVKRSAL